MKKRSVMLISIVLLLSLVLSACGGGGGKTEGGAKDKLTVATAADATTLDPSAQNDSYASNVMSQIYDGLIEIDQDGVVHEKLAESYETPDNLTYIFHLKKGVKFHNGEELKASDVKFTFDRALKSPAVAHIFADIDPDSLETPDDYTFQFKLKEPYAGTLEALCHPAAFIVNEKAVTEAGDKYATNPVGTGAFKFVSWSKAHNVVLERFEDYHGELPVFKTLEFRIIPEGTNRIIELETGGVDIAMDIAPNDVSKVEGNDELKALKIADYGTTFMGINTQKEQFKDPRVRQAIAYSIDLEAIVGAVWKGVGRAASAPYTGSIKYSIAEDRPVTKRDPEKAKQLLAEAGYPDGFSCKITTNERQERIDAATIMKEDLKEVGIDVTVEVLEWSAFIEMLENGEQDMYIMAWISDSPDPDMVVYPCFHSSMAGPGGNYSFFNDPECDEMIVTGRRTPDGDERKQIYEDLQERIMELVPSIFIYNSEIVIGTRNNIENVQLTPFGYHRFYPVTFKE